jgi:cytochrome P450 family 109
MSDSADNRAADTKGGALHFSPLGDREFLMNPYPVFEKMRREAPVYRHTDTLVPLVSVFGYDNVKRVYEDWENFSSVNPMLKPAPGKRVFGSLLKMDPPDHTRMRGIIGPMFLPGFIRQQEAMVRGEAQRNICLIKGQNELEVVEELAGRMTVGVICNLAGIPEKDHQMIRDWTLSGAEIEGNMLFQSEYNEQEMKRLTRFGGGLMQYFEDHVDSLIANPGDDLVSRLSTSELSREELIDFTQLLVGAGNETTAGLITNVIRVLLDQPEELAMVLADQSILPTVIEEVVRYWPPVRGGYRHAVNELELDGVKINSGDTVWVWGASANRDEGLNERAGEFVLERKKRQHIAFAKGVHTCIGNALARIETRCVLEELFSQLAGISKSEEAPQPLGSVTINGLRSLPVKCFWNQA